MYSLVFFDASAPCLCVARLIGRRTHSTKIKPACSSTTHHPTDLHNLVISEQKHSSPRTLTLTMDGGWPTGASNQQGSTSSPSVSQIIFQLNQLYGILQTFYPQWSQENPFWPAVNGRDDAQLCELHVTWTQWVEYVQAQTCADALMRWVSLS